MADEIRASHILVNDKQQAEQLKQALESGSDFAELARNHSQGPSSENGGDLGYFGKGEMAKPFERAAFDLEVGEVSDPVKTEFGWHLIKKTDER
ncbi:MAG: peptidylprolyl isomerase [Candidatus Nanohaloarchaea archaeon]|nr:peptidylprolyl isomerase [Candidatus Nanohaloarchaea archaeon]